jgi:hypothetical protein
MALPKAERPEPRLYGELVVLLMFTEVVPLVSLIVVEEIFRLLELVLLPLLEVLLLTSRVA